MDTMEVTVAERGQIVIPKQARDAMGISAGTRLELRVVEGQLIVTKRVRLNLDKWLGSAPDDGLTTGQALQELRGRPVPWTGSERDERVLALPHAQAVALLAGEAQRRPARGKAPARKNSTKDSTKASTKDGGKHDSKRKASPARKAAVKATHAKGGAASKARA